jgi:hypothetical protein
MAKTTTFTASAYTPTTTTTFKTTISTTTTTTTKTTTTTTNSLTFKSTTTTLSTINYKYYDDEQSSSVNIMNGGQNLDKQIASTLVTENKAVVRKRSAQLKLEANDNNMIYLFEENKYFFIFGIILLVISIFVVKLSSIANKKKLYFISLCPIFGLSWNSATKISPIKTKENLLIKRDYNQNDLEDSNMFEIDLEEINENVAERLRNDEDKDLKQRF